MMTKREQKVLQAITDLGGEATSSRIHGHLVGQGRWGWVWAFGMYADLFRLERHGVLTSRWGEATATTGWNRPRIYRLNQGER